MLTVPVLNDVDVAFPSNPPLPPMAEIPAQFKRRGDPMVRVVSSLFFNGGSLAQHGLKFKSGINERNAMRAIKACLGSFQPKHEHKEAGVAYMLSEWCEPA